MKIFVLAIFSEGGKEPVNHAILADSLMDAAKRCTAECYPALATCSAFTLSVTAFASTYAENNA